MTKQKEQHLAMAEQHVVEAEQRITDQSLLIERLRVDGLDTTDAEALLETFSSILVEMRKHLQTILSEQ